MSIYDTAYDTTFGVTLGQDHVQEILIPRLFSTQDYRQRCITKFKDVAIYYISPFTNLEIFDIPSFNNPLLLNYDNRVKNKEYAKVLVSDIRSYVNEKSTIKEDRIITSNPTELTFVMFRTVLSAMWVNGDIREIRLSLSFANIVYAAWISDTVSKRFGLNFTEQLDVFIIAFYFYNMLMSNSPLSEDQKTLLTKACVQASRSTATYVLNVVEKITPMNDIYDLIECVKTVVPNRRLAELNIGTLMTIISSTWYGTHSKEILAVSLEHLPTFMAIVAVSVTQRFYKKSMITQIAERYGKGGLLENYISNVNRILRDEPKL